MSKWMRVLVGLGVLLAACVAYGWLFGIQTFYVWETRRAARTEPFLWNAPIRLPDVSISQKLGARLSYFGYEFEVPWEDIDREKTKVIGPTMALIVFRSGNAISFWSSLPNGLMNKLTADGKIDPRYLAQVFGSESVQSDYAFQRAILETTPREFSVLMAKRRAIQLGMLFEMKAVALRPGADSGVFSISTKEFEGFQYGRPQGPSNRLSVELFASDGHVDIIFGQKLNGSATISQADVNRVVQSVHRVLGQELRTSR
jgi:hypothetical protein